MRYTLFIRCPETGDVRFHEGNDLDESLDEADAIFKAEPKTIITVCDRRTDTMLFNAEWGGKVNVSLTGMCD